MAANTTIPLPATGRPNNPVGTANCPHCGKRIGMETRCRHVDVLLTPSENGGEWGLLVWDEAFDVPMLKMEKRNETPRDWCLIDKVRHALMRENGTERDIRDRAEINLQGAAASAIQRLRKRGEIAVVAVHRVEESGPRGRMRPAKVYGLTGLGRQRASENKTVQK